MAVRVDHGVVSGTFSLDGETHDVDNNIWVVGDDEECVVIDAPHDVDAILEVVAGRTVKAIICTHAHDDHVRVAPELRERVGAPILLHPDDRPLWELTHPRTTCGTWTSRTARRSRSAGAAVKAIHTPGHAPGAVCLYVHDLGCVFTGDTLFQGGPGATGRSYSDEEVIVESIRAPALRAARRDGRPHRARRRHHDRGGAGAAGLSARRPRHIGHGARAVHALPRRCSALEVHESPASRGILQTQRLNAWTTSTEARRPGRQRTARAASSVRPITTMLAQSAAAQPPSAERSERRPTRPR